MQFITRTPTRSYFITMFVVVSLLFLTFSLVIYRNYEVAQRLNQWTFHNYEVIRHTRKILIDLIDMETSVRGYLITGQKKFLKPYNKSKQTLNAQISALTNYVKYDPTTKKKIDTWLKQIEQFSITLDSQIDRYNNSLFDKTPLAEMDKQKQQMDRIRVMLEGFIQVRLDDLNVRLEQAKLAENNFKYILGIGTALAIATMLIATLVILSLIRRSEKAEADSLEVESRFQMVMNAVNDGLFDFDVEHQSIYFSPQYKLMLGYEENEVPSTLEWIKSAMHPDDEGAIWKTYDDYSKKLLPIYRNVFRLRKKNGEWIWILSRGIGLFNASGTMTRLIGTHTDISEHKQREEELATLNKEMETFTYITSHDLRAPLVNLKGFSGELNRAIKKIQPIIADKKQTFLESEYATLAETLEHDIPESLGFIAQSVEKMDALTTALLDLSRIGKREYRYEPVDVAIIIKRCLDSLAYEITQKNITVTFANLPLITSDALAIEQVFSNILDNAVKYLDSTRAGEITIKTQSLGNGYVFSIADNGRGIAKADYDKVFHIFRRARNSSDVRGSGLGMAFVQATVRRLGGAIWFTSEQDLGTTFYFSIPNNPTKKGSTHA